MALLCEHVRQPHQRPGCGLVELSGRQTHLLRPGLEENVISPNWKFITDVRAGKLANFTWITPICSDSDHVNCPGGYGPSWVAALVNTVGESKFWDSTAIFVQWDDWGGLYDHVPPPYSGRTASASACRC